MYQALIALALVAPADTPIEPIEEALVELLVESADGVELCGQIGEMEILFDTLAGLLGDPGTVDVFKDMALTYWVDAFESGFGPQAALTAEGEGRLVEWIEGCRT